MAADDRSRTRDLLEFIPAWLLLKVLGSLPRTAALLAGKVIARATFHVHPKLRKAGDRNLELAFPELSPDCRRELLLAVFDNLGRLLGEFSHFPKLAKNPIEQIVVYEGLDNYERAAARKRGVLLLTGHFGSWELCAFAQGRYGRPLSFLVRPLDNPLLDKLINTYRELSGNKVIDKNRAVRPVLETLKRSGDVGMLIDANTLPEEGLFCDFFGIPASSTTGLAVFALRTAAPVVPGFLIYDAASRVHRLIFEPEIPLVRTGDFREDVRVNTARFTKAIEESARRYPAQWLWVHKRWKTRPEGEPDLYAPQETARDLSSSRRGATA